MSVAFALLVACSGKPADEPPAVQVDAWVAEAVPTSLFVALDGDGLQSAEVQVVAGDRSWLALAGPDLLDQGHDLLAHLPALPEDAVLEVRATVQVDGETLELDPLSVQTGAIPDDLPRPSVEGEPVPTWSFTGHGLATWIPLVLAPDGTPAWWVQPEWADTAVIRLRPLPDGTGVRLLRFPILAVGGDTDVPAGFVDLRWDGTVRRVVERPAAHHDFAFLPDGRCAWFEYEPREIDGVTVQGDTLWVGEPDGDPVAVWTSWDWLEYEPERDEEAAGLRYATLANAVEYDPFHDRLLVGLKQQGAVLAVDPDGGEQQWRFSAIDGDVALAEPGRHPSGQHGIQATTDGFRLFDNGRSEDGASRAVAYALDEEARTAEQLWEHTTDPPHYALVLGDVRDLGGGRSRVAWSARGVLEDIDADGQVLGRIVVDEDAFVGFLHVEADPFPDAVEQAP